MYQVVLNDQPQAAGNAWKTWGELLQALDDQCAARGQVVTAVRFDGVEQPAFRGTGLAAYGLDGLAAVEIEAVPPGQLLTSTIEQTIGAVDSLQHAAERIGGDFRGFNVSTANQELADLAGSLGSMVTIAGVLSQAVGVDLAQLSCNGASGSRMVDELLGHTDALISAQEIGDWITLADILEYDVAPTLRRWPALFRAIGASVPVSPAA